MRPNLAVKLAIFSFAGFVSATASAVECAETPLTAGQQDFLAVNAIQIIKPVGDTPTILRCDTNADLVIDMADIRAIALKRDQPIAYPNDPMDWDKNKVINLLDARGCQQACTLPRCAPGGTPPVEQPPELVDTTECFQAEDLDNDGQPDQVTTISQNTKTNTDGSVNLGVVVLREAQGQVTFFKDSYAGRSREGKVSIHLARQPPGIVNLMPGTIELTEPGTIAYEYGVPKTLYYWKDGVLLRAPFFVGD